MKKMTKLVLNGIEYTVTDENAVSFAEHQNRTEEEKAQARQNLGAADAASIGDMDTALDRILAVQNALIGGGVCA